MRLKHIAEGDTDLRNGELPLKNKSLARQVVGIVVVAQLLCAIALCTAALMNERHTRLRALDAQLQGRSDSLLGAVQDAEDPDADVTLDPAELKLPKLDTYAVYNQGGRLLGSSESENAELTQRTQDGFHDVRVNGQTYRVYQREALRIIDRAEHGGVGLRRPVTIVYAASERHVWHEILEAASFYLCAIFVATFVTVLIVAFSLRRALQPLSELAMAAEQTAAPSLHFDAPASALSLRELRPLTVVLGNTVARLRESFAREHQFVSDAAHELKTALAVVRSSVQLLMLKPRSTAEYSNGLTRLLDDTERVESLVGRMLQQARLEERVAVDTNVVDLREAAKQITMLLEPIAAQKDVRFDLETSGSPLVRLHPDSLEILLSNLILNAVQHSHPSSSVEIVLKEAQHQVQLQVSDHGSGISQAALPYIFDRFFREDTSRSRATGGTGLGLSMCKSIVENAGGSITVDSAPGKGTTMIVTFISP